MTAGELVLFTERASVVATAVAKVIKIWRETQTFPHRDAEILRISIEQTLALCRGKAVAATVRFHIAEIAETSRWIEALDMEDYARKQAMKQLEILSIALTRNLNDLMRSIS